MMSELEEIVVALDALPERGRGRRYPSELKAQICAYLAERRKAGVAWARLSAELSIPTNTLQRWHGGRTPASTPNVPTFLPVQVREPDVGIGTGGLILETRDGWCVRGLSLGDVVRLLSHRS